MHLNDPKCLETIHTDPYSNDNDVFKPFRRNLGHFQSRNSAFWVKSGGKISNFEENSIFSTKTVHLNDPKCLETIHTDRYSNDNDVFKPFKRDLGHFRSQKLAFWAQIRR